MKEFRKRKVDFLKNIAGIPQHKLRFYRLTEKYEGHFELWLIPVKK